MTNEERLINARDVEFALLAIQDQQSGIPETLAGWLARVVIDAPTVDAVRVIRCKNCICHEDSSLRGKVWCLKMCRYMAEDGYCSESKNI